MDALPARTSRESRLNLRFPQLRRHLSPLQIQPPLRSFPMKDLFIFLFALTVATCLFCVPALAGSGPSYDDFAMASPPPCPAAQYLVSYAAPAIPSPPACAPAGF